MPSELIRSPPPCQSKEHVTIPAGRWKKVPGRFKSERYIVCSVVKDVAVGQIGCAKDAKAAALPNKQACNVPAGRWKKVPGRFKLRAITDPPCKHRQGTCQNSSGALEESAGKVQNASST